MICHNSCFKEEKKKKAAEALAITLQSITSNVCSGLDPGLYFSFHLKVFARRTNTKRGKGEGFTKRDSLLMILDYI